ncbi:hypothetical protein J2Z53_001774 [Clostridium moniliforme]|uniref:DUF1836 domain-containing protein n=1 Tax=Clostridium moniliforme TaxID=39489 RepID=A0ABS4F1R6_9CLOT|nr:DUF1836 domain-containing protein [Clostridium moniliforme]MBP1890184.1 hypothetical protein [Clostridium moniliforme]
MEREEIIKLIEELALEKNISLEEIPEIDLYMDQVIQLFENKYNDCKRNTEDKILTKTMINNYAKGKLLIPIKSKKYSKEHLILMSLIYNLKGGLSLGDIKTCLNPIINQYENGEEINLREIYKVYLEQSKDDTESFKKDVLNRELSVKDKVKDVKNKEFEEKFLLLCSMINMSNMYRKMGEKLIDEFFEREGKDK